MLRISLDPTRDLHIGDLQLALAHYIVALQRNESLMVSVEDIDTTKTIAEKDKELVALLQLFGIEHQGIIYQSEQLRFYQQMTATLLHENRAFRCFCSEDMLLQKASQPFDTDRRYAYDGTCQHRSDEDAMAKQIPFRVRFSKPNSVFALKLTNGNREFSCDDLDHIIIMDHNARPSHCFASAVDEMLSDVSFVLLRNEQLFDVAHQKALQDALGYEKTVEYCIIEGMLPQANEASNSELPSVKTLLQEGFLPSALIEYLLNLQTDAPLSPLTVEDAIQYFDIARLQSEPMHFNYNALRIINQNHLKSLRNSELSNYVGFADEHIGALCKLFLDECTTTLELKYNIAKVFGKKIVPNTLEQSAKTVKEAIATAPYFEAYDEFYSYLRLQTSLKTQELNKTVNYLLLGQESTLENSAIYACIKSYLKEVVQ